MFYNEDKRYIGKYFKVMRKLPMNISFFNLKTFSKTGFKPFFFLSFYKKPKS